MDDSDSSGSSGRQQLQAKSKAHPQAGDRHVSAAGHAGGKTVFRTAAAHTPALKAQKEAKPAPAATTSPAAPAAPLPVKAAPLQNPAAAIVVIPSAIKYKSTPDKMPNRIPAIQPHTVSVSVSNVGNSPVRIFIDNAGEANGSAGINGYNEIIVREAGTYALELRGALQTKPGNGDKLRLAAEQDGSRLGQSGTFSVSTIPQDWNTTFLSPINTPGKPNSDIGIWVKDIVSADSVKKPVEHLAEVEVSECVSTVDGDGYLKKSRKLTSDYLPVSSNMKDEHSFGPRKIMTSESFIIQAQTTKFHDKRTGAKDIPVANSGYLIEHRVVRTGNKKFRYTISKKGAAVTADGITSDAAESAVPDTSFDLP